MENMDQTEQPEHMLAEADRIFASPSSSAAASDLCWHI